MGPRIEYKPTFCRICEPLCGMVATVEDGRLVALRPDKDHPLSSGFACQKGIAFAEVVNDPDRVTHPLRRTPDGGFEEVGWDEALADIADRMTAIHGRYGSGAFGWYMGKPRRVQLLTPVRRDGLHQGHRRALPLLHVIDAGHQQPTAGQPVPVRVTADGADPGSDAH